MTATTPQIIQIIVRDYPRRSRRNLRSTLIDTCFGEPRDGAQKIPADFSSRFLPGKIPKNRTRKKFPLFNRQNLFRNLRRSRTKNCLVIPVRAYFDDSRLNTLDLTDQPFSERRVKNPRGAHTLPRCEPRFVTNLFRSCPTINSNI